MIAYLSKMKLILIMVVLLAMFGIAMGLTEREQLEMRAYNEYQQCLLSGDSSVSNSFVCISILRNLLGNRKRRSSDNVPSSLERIAKKVKLHQGSSSI